MSLIKIISQLTKASGAANVPPPPPPNSGGTPLYIINGQSNTGRAREIDLTSGEASLYGSALGANVKTWNCNRFEYQGEKFTTMDLGVNTLNMNSTNADEFGPEVSLAKSMEGYNSKQRYYFKHGVGNTALAYEWALVQNGAEGFAYRQFKDYLNDMLAEKAAQGINDMKLHAFIWMQGENDAINATYAANYLSNLTAFFNDFNNWWVNVKGMNGDYKKVIGRIQDIGAGHEAQVRAAQEAYCANPANNAILINTDSYPRRDYIHFSATGQIQFGIDIFNQIKDL